MIYRDIISLLLSIIIPVGYSDGQNCELVIERPRLFFSKISICLGPEADLRGVDLRGERIENISLEGADLRWAQLDGVQMVHVNLSHAILDKSSMQGANIKSVNFSWASLESVDLRGAIIVDSEFSYANMQGADFGPIPGYALPAEVIRSNFTNTNLNGARLD